MLIQILYCKSFVRVDKKAKAKRTGQRDRKTEVYTFFFYLGIRTHEITKIGK